MDLAWTFYGYITPAGGREVQDWYDGLPEEARDEIRDTVAYLQRSPIRVWRKPEFYLLGDGLSEIRCKVNELNKIVRIYGCFWPKTRQHSYTLLLGAEKKKSNPKHDMAEARKRKGKLESGTVSIHEFEF